MIKSLSTFVAIFVVSLLAVPLWAQTTPIAPVNIFLPFITEIQAPVAQATAVSPTATPTTTVAQPTATTVQPTATSIPATATPQPTATSVPNAVCDCSGNTLNCSDFSRQVDAQACFDYCMAQVGIDIHKLDQNNDGVACESLPVWIISIIK